MFDELLEKDEALSIQIVGAMSTLDTGEYTFKELADLTDTSEFVLQRYLKELNQKWKEIFQRDLVVFAGNKLLFEHEIHSAEQATFKESITTGSVAHQFLQTLLLGRLNVQEFAKSHYISLSKTYELRKRLVILLKKQFLSIRKNQITGDEKNIRGFMLGYFLRYGAIFNELDETALDRIRHLTQLVEELSEKPLLESQRQRLMVFQAVCEIRFKEEHWIKDAREIRFYQDKRRSLHRINQWLLVPEEILSQESCYFLSYLVSFEYPLNVHYDFSADALMMSWQQQLVDFLSDNTLSDEEKPQFTQDFIRILLLCHEFQGYGISSNASLEAFLSFYEVTSRKEASLARLVDRCLKTKVPEADRELLRLNGISLWYNYEWTRDQRKRLTVCVDFYSERTYSKYFEKMLEKRSIVPLKFVSVVNANVDVYISDTYHKKFQGFQQVVDRHYGEQQLNRLLELFQKLYQAK